MKSHFLTPLLASIIIACTASAAEKKTILLIGKQPDHPHGTHMYLHTCKVLAKCLELTEGIEAVVSDGWPDDVDLLKRTDSIVVYTNPAAELLLLGKPAKQIDLMMKSGVGLVTIHWASSVFQKNFDRLGAKWMSYLGGTWISNVGIMIGESDLKQLAPDHPVSRGWKPYLLRDEWYLKPTIGPEATPFLQVTAKGEGLVVAWAFERPGGGRSYGTTLGHFYDNFQNDAFRRTIVNAALWTAGLEVPAQGAPVNISKAALQLPPAK